MNFNIGIDIGTRNVRMAVEGYGVAFTATAAQRGGHAHRHGR